MRVSPLDPAHAAVGDLATAMIQVDSRLRQLHDDPVRESKEYRDELEGAFKTAEPEQVVEGLCTLLYLLMTWLREAFEQAGGDVVAEVIPYTTLSLSRMPKNIEREAIPVIGAMLVACALDLSPNLWREQYGPWTMSELKALEATAVLLAEQVNCWAGDPEFASGLVLDILAAALDDDAEPAK